MEGGGRGGLGHGGGLGGAGDSKGKAPRHSIDSLHSIYAEARVEVGQRRYGWPDLVGDEGGGTSV